MGRQQAEEVGGRMEEGRGREKLRTDILDPPLRLPWKCDVGRRVHGCRELACVPMGVALCV